jgi:GNAT superfamily N-acetyltransferase
MRAVSVDEIAELNRLSCRGVAATIGGTPALIRVEDDWALVLSGEAQADLNLLIVGDVADPETVLEQGLAEARARGLPLLAAFTQASAKRVAPLARRRKLKPGGEVPLMVLREGAALERVDGYEIERVRDAKGVREMGALVADAFALPRTAVRRAVEAAALRDGVEVLLARRPDGVAMSAVTLTLAGETTGIWSMATPPRRQRKGAGRALLTAAIAAKRAEGTRRFFLWATPSGRPLYDLLGFEAVATYSSWVEGQATHI